MIGINEGDTILDVGSGTGILLPFLKQASGENGHITAIDFAARMIALSSAKHQYLSGITYIVGDILELELQQTFQKIICFNFFPHINDKPAFLNKMKVLLKPYGSLVIMHDISRRMVNGIHASSDTVTNDRLPECEKVSEMLLELGYSVHLAQENDEYYFIKGIVNDKTNL